MSYEIGDKFVMEIAEIFESGEKKLYRMKDFASLVFDENGLQRLRRIRETTEEAYNRGYTDGAFCGAGHPVVGQSEEQLAKARAEGAEEAWNFRNKSMYDLESEESRWYKSEAKIYSEMTYAEVKAKFAKWKEWEPKVGDVVRSKRLENYFGAIIDGKHSNGEVGVWWKFGGGASVPVDALEPTGRHVDLSNILKVLEEVEHE